MQGGVPVTEVESHQESTFTPAKSQVVGGDTLMDTKDLDAPRPAVPPREPASVSGKERRLQSLELLRL
jgi:hypothetical protein